MLHFFNTLRAPHPRLRLAFSALLVLGIIATTTHSSGAGASSLRQRTTPPAKLVPISKAKLQPQDVSCRSVNFSFATCPYVLPAGASEAVQVEVVRELDGSEGCAVLGRFGLGMNTEGRHVWVSGGCAAVFRIFFDTDDPGPGPTPGPSPTPGPTPTPDPGSDGDWVPGPDLVIAQGASDGTDVIGIDPSCAIVPDAHFEHGAPHNHPPRGFCDEDRIVQHGFRTYCTTSHFSYEDPVVFNGPASADSLEARRHLHIFWGNSSVGVTDSSADTHDELQLLDAGTCEGASTTFRRTGCRRCSTPTAMLSSLSRSSSTTRSSTHSVPQRT